MIPYYCLLRARVTHKIWPMVVSMNVSARLSTPVVMPELPVNVQHFSSETSVISAAAHFYKTWMFSRDVRSVQQMRRVPSLC